MYVCPSMVSIQVDDEVQSKEKLLEEEPLPVDNIPPLETDFTLSTRVQLASMLAFAYIWSCGAFVPSR